MNDRGRRDSGASRSARAGHRHARLQHLITELVDAVVRDELSDPAVEDVVLTGTQLSPDGHHLFVWFTTASDTALALVALERSAAFIRTRILDRLGLDRVPHLHFSADPRSLACLE